MTDEELSLAAQFIWGAVRGDESRPFNLVAAMKNANVNVTELARRLGVTRREIQRWRKGEGRPSRPVALQIAKELNLHPYRVLHGLSAPTRHQPAVEYNPRALLTGQNFAAARRILSMNQEEFAKAAGVTRAHIQRIEQARSIPSEHLQRSQRVLRELLAKHWQRLARNEAQRKRRALRREQDRARSAASGA